MLERGTWTLEWKSILQSSLRSSRHHGLQNILGARNSRSSGGFSARADIKFMGFPESVLELKFDNPTSFLAYYGSNLTYACTNMVPTPNYNTMEFNFTNWSHAYPKLTQTHAFKVPISNSKHACPFRLSFSFQMMSLVLIPMKFNKNMLACGITLPIFHNLQITC